MVCKAKAVSYGIAPSGGAAVGGGDHQLQVGVVTAGVECVGELKLAVADLMRRGILQWVRRCQDDCITGRTSTLTLGPLNHPSSSRVEAIVTHEIRNC